MKQLLCAIVLMCAGCHLCDSTDARGERGEAAGVPSAPTYAVAKDEKEQGRVLLIVSPPELHRAILQRDIRRVEEMIAAGVPVDAFAAAGLNDVDRLKAMLEQRPSLMRSRRHGANLLHWAVNTGSVDTTELLLSHGADPDDGWLVYGCCLSIAVAAGDAQMVEFLLGWGVSPMGTLADPGGPLREAVQADNVALAQRLIRAGADPQCGVDGHSLLEWAAGGTNRETTEFLLGYEVDPKRRADALISAAGNGNIDAVSVLLGHGVRSDAVERNGWTPLLCAVEAGSYACVARLLEAGASPYVTDDEGRNGLHVLARSSATNAQDVRRILVALRGKGISLGAEDAHGYSAAETARESYNAVVRQVFGELQQPTTPRLRPVKVGTCR